MEKPEDAKRGKMHGTLLSPEEAERVRRMLDEPEAVPPLPGPPLSFVDGEDGLVYERIAEPPRATTAEPMTEERLAAIRNGSDARELRSVRELLAEVDRLRSPSRDSGALPDVAEAQSALARLLLDGASEDMESLARDHKIVFRALSTLERDAARMREAWAFLAASTATVHCNYIGGDDAWSATVNHLDGGDDTVRHGPTPLAAVEALRAALAPSGEPSGS